MSATPTQLRLYLNRKKKHDPIVRAADKLKRNQSPVVEAVRKALGH